MCDTLGLILEGRALFGKNSDRSPNEAQVCEYHAAANPQESLLKTTYLTIQQVQHTHACLLSRPVWMWGAEMGVNEFGVCIGNEAVFTRGAYSKLGLTGMDLLRLGLERGATAHEALEVILALLEEYGQGGNCGFDHNFFYDNSFLIMDREHVYVLETAGKNWAYKIGSQASISNRLTLGRNADSYSGNEIVDFRKKYSDPLFTHFSGSKSRWNQTCSMLPQIKEKTAVFNTLRRHASGVQKPLCQASLSSPCMHAGGPIGDHTTASMVVEMDEGIKVWLTGSSTPCISLFKPWKFGDPTTAFVIDPSNLRPDAYWQERESFHRSMIGSILPEAFYVERAKMEYAWMWEAEIEADWSALSRKAVSEEAQFFARWSGNVALDRCGSSSFLSYWEKKNQKLNKTY